MHLHVDVSASNNELILSLFTLQITEHELEIICHQLHHYHVSTVYTRISCDFLRNNF